MSNTKIEMRNRWNRGNAIGAALLLCCVPRAVHADDADRLKARTTPAVRVFRACSPAVVNLSTTTIVTLQRPFGLDLLFEDIFDVPRARPRQYETHSVGSGFLIHRDGYLVTNAHVVEQAAEIKVTFADGTELAAEEVARDRKNDLAVLKVDADHPLPFLTLGRSDDLMQGETVIAIGNPLGYQHTVTTGVISALDRELRFGGNLVYSGLIQTDASINPGNSGGPLLNVFGELIGINTAIRGDAQNIGFAIAVDHLHDLLPSMLDIERLRRVDFGIHFDGARTGTKTPGVIVRRVDPGSSAEAAGVREGDVVAAIDGASTNDFMDAFSRLAQAPTGSVVKLDITRDGQRRTIEVPLAEIKLADAAKMMEQFFGLRVRELKRDELRRLGLRRAVGLYVDAIRPGTEAAGAGIEPGDIITLFGGWPVTSLAALGQFVTQVEPGDRIPFQILRIRRRGWNRYELGLRAQ